MATLAVGLAIAAVALWVWSGSDRSLATVLARAAASLPADQSLQWRGVSGSLRAGGHIDWLRWQSGTLAVEVQDVRTGWQLRPLLQRRLQFSELHAARVQIERRGIGDDVPPVPPTQLMLPLDIDLPWRIDALHWLGPVPLSATDIEGHYRHADAQHRLTLSHLAFAEGHYRGQATLQGPAPMRLEAVIDGEIRVPLDLAESRTLAALAQVRATGALAGASAQLQIAAEIAPAGADAVPPMQASVHARLFPWQLQPVADADATLRGIDLARLWPQAPATQLSGTLQLRPAAATASGADSAGWQARATLDNAIPGPWDRGRLPIGALTAALDFDGSQWTLADLTLGIGGGRIRAQGRWHPGPQPWEVRAMLHQVPPGALHTRLAGAPLSGRIHVQQRDVALHFDAGLRADGAQPTGVPRSLRLRMLSAQGQWRAPVLALRALRVEAERAQLDGSFQADLDAQAGSGRIDLMLPGARAQAQGRIAPRQGDATLAARIDDAGALQSWLQALPGMANALGGLSAQGRAQFDARWQGGWQAVQRRLAQADPSTVPPESDAQIQAALTVPELGLQGAALASLTGESAMGPVPALQLRGVRAELAGRLAHATLVLRGEAVAGARMLQLDTQASGGLQSPGEWRTTISRLRAHLRAGSAQTARWDLVLAQDFAATVRTGKTFDVEASGGALTLRGPAPGEAHLEWQPLSVSLAPGSGSGALRLRSAGRLQGVPMAWLQAVGNPAYREFTEGSDLLFDGDWSIDTTDTLRAQARLARRSGDLRVDVGESALVTRVHSTGTGSAREIQLQTQGSGGGMPAGLRQAELRIEALGDALRATLAWDSERAGVMQAEVSTRLVRSAEGWQWPAHAMLAGRVKARLPRLGVWSTLAPPGWRVDGTLDADAVLSGDRTAPQWRGTISAEQLALRAAVEGIDLHDGRLRATFGGDRLRIDEFTLHGGTGASARIGGRSGNTGSGAEESARDGGLLTVRGELNWSHAPDEAGSGIGAALQGELRRLRVMARSDRQLTLSGDVQAQLSQGQISVRGQLKADRAAILLPDENAPSLGSDVVVRSATRDRAAQAGAREADAPVRPPRTRRPPDIALDFDLGHDFAVQGRGITTRLEGQLQARAVSTAAPPRLTGEVRTVRGQYRAYGQQLDVENGVLRFSGPIDNPALDILAIRPNIAHRAGVHITGTVQSPRLKLFSEPPLSDAETLSWVILGRAEAASGGEAVLMQQAALALLGKLGAGGPGSSLASHFGLDEIGLRGPGTGGDITTSTITLGKRLSKDFYATYERSLAGTLGTFYIFYDLTRNLTLRGQAGERYGADLIYTIKYD